MKRPVCLRAVRVLAMLAAVAAGIASPRQALAQVNAALVATAAVNNTALTVSNPQDLDFGTVVRGVARTINPRTSASAGYFVIQGARNAQLRITMTLPTVLTTGSSTMPITFGAQGGCWRRTNAQNGCTYWNPATALVQRIRNQNPPNNHFNVWMGGTVTPSAAQPAGVYSGTITLTVVYTGN